MEYLLGINWRLVKICTNPYLSIETLPGSISLIALVVLAIVTGCINSSRPGKMVKILSIILYVSASVCLILCILVNVASIQIVCAHFSPENTAVLQWTTDFLYRKFYWYLFVVSFVFMLITLPVARTRREITEASMLFFISSSLVFFITILSGEGAAGSHWNLGAHAPVLPLLICLAIFALRFGIMFIAAVLKQKDTFTKIIIGLLVFHLANLCMYVYLIWIISARSISAGY